MRIRRMFLFLLLGAPLAPPAWAEDPPEIAIAYLGGRFDPAEVAVPANVKVALRIENKSSVTMEWESGAMHREKVVAAAKIYIGPLRPGRYEFFDDFRPTIRGGMVIR